MRIRAPLFTLLLVGCVPWDPPASELSTSSGSPEPELGTSTGWQLPPRERGKPTTTSTSTTTSTTTASTSPPEPDTDPDTDPPATGAPRVPTDLSVLRLAEVHPDPDGKDGGPDSPEFIEIVHVGAEPVALADLEIVARAWPIQTAAELGLADAILEPGQRLLLTRFADASALPDPPVSSDPTGLRVAFAAADGLRNADGGVLLRAGGLTGDVMIYGAAQPAPWDDPAAWLGPAAPKPGSGASLCRLASVDHDDASDWQICPASPGGPGEEATSETGEAPGTTGTIETGSTGEPLPAELAIVEVLSNPPGPGELEKHGEFVEIVNLGPGSVDLAGWTIADDSGEAPTGADPLLYLTGDGGCAPNTCLAAGQRALIVGKVYTGAVGPGLVLVTDDTTIANAGLAVHEPVVLRDSEGLLASSYRVWPDPLAMPDPALMEAALVRIDPAAADVPEAWSFAAPTPGL